MLTLTGAGTTAPGGDLTGSKNMQGSTGSGTFSVAGGQANGVSYLLDGGDNNDAFSNVNLPIPFPDAVQEFSVQTNGVSAQYGLHPGGVVNIVTKSGTNALARRPLRVSPQLRSERPASAAPPARDSLKRSQFGGVVGGTHHQGQAVLLRRLSGHAAAQRSRRDHRARADRRRAQRRFQRARAAQSAGGCLASARALKDPANGNAPFPGNQIPDLAFRPGRREAGQELHPDVRRPLRPVPLRPAGQQPRRPGRSAASTTCAATSTRSTAATSFTTTRRQTFFDGKNALTTGPNPGNRDRSHTVTFGDTYTFSPTKVNSFHATFNRRADNRGSASNLFSPNDLGINMFNNLPNYIQLTVSNYFNVACGTCAPGYFNINTFQVSDDFT